MKKDPALMRRLLLLIEEKGPGRFVGEPEGEHIRLLHSGGYLEASSTLTVKGREWHIVQLTWKGSETLDAIRSDAQWAAIQERLAGQSVPFEVIEQLAFALAQRSVGLQPVTPPTAGDTEGSATATEQQV